MGPGRHEQTKNRTTTDSTEKPWIYQEHERLTAKYAGRWQTWFVPQVQPHGYAWCGRPEGASASVVQARTPQELETAISAYEAQLPKHLAQARKELAGTNPDWHGRVQLLSSRIAALEHLQRLGPMQAGGEEL